MKPDPPKERTEGADPADASARSLVGQRIAHYQVVSLLGAGGMGEVYLAQDVRLHRRVAIKVLPPRLTADQEATRRFLREAQTAAGLDHPSICAIHEVGEDAGRSFIVMQYVEGESLAAKLARERLAWPLCLALAQQIADALAEAHAHRIIHRDVKPANVMVTPRGQVKVLDFGLAKALPAGEPADTQMVTASLLSTPGMMVGTAPYMSPEQVRGERMDARTDIWSFGVVLYEMLSGRRPFDAKSSVEILSAILTQPPPPLSDLAARAPELHRVLSRCLEKDPACRYQTMPELLTDLRAARLGIDDGSIEPSLPAADLAPATASRVADSGEPPPRASIASAPGGGAPVARWRGLLASRAAVAIAVALVVAAAVAAYSLLFLDDAPAPVEGVAASTAPAGADIPDAYDYYLRGKVMVSDENRQSNEAAIDLLERAVGADPGLASAFAELARAYNIKAFFYAPPDERDRLYLDAKVAVEKALALDPNLAEAHHARGVILWTHANRYPHEQAIQAFKRALALNPELHETHHRLGMIYIHIGLLEEARAELARALALNPANTNARFRLGIVQMFSGDYEEALGILEGIPRDANPTLVEGNLAMAYLRLGRLDDAAAVLEHYMSSTASDEGGTVTSARALLLAHAGRAPEADAMIRRALEMGKGYGHFHHTAHNAASTYALLGRPDEAIEWLDVAVQDGFPCLPCYEKDETLDSLRDDGRFIELMTRLRRLRERYLLMVS